MNFRFSAYFILLQFSKTLSFCCNKVPIHRAHQIVYIVYNAFVT